MDPSYADTKEVLTHFEDIATLESGIDPKVEARLVRKLDIWIMPLMTMIFLLNFIDRSAVGNANVAGLSRDLGLSAAKYEYNIGLMVFYIVYIIVEPASNLILKKVGAKWLAVLTLGFGVVTIASAFMKSFTDFLVIRILLGAFEGGVIPGIAFVLSRFYRRHELVLRIGIFLALGPSLSGAFGGLLAGALITGTSIGGVLGWRKIFLVEGIITSGFAVIVWFFVVTSPETAKFLNEEERAVAIQRLAAEQIGGKSASNITTGKDVRQGFANAFTWLCATGYACINIPVQGTSIFLPTVIRTLGTFSTVEVQLRSVPPYVVATAWTLSVSYAAYRTRKHGIFVAGSVIFSTIGYIIFVSTTNNKVLYFATFITYSGAVPCGPLFLAWATANSSPETARALASAIVPAWGTMGSIAATWAYLPKFAPRFTPGNALNVGSTALAFIMAIGLIGYVRWENRQREQGKRDHRLVGLTIEEQEALGHRHPSFRYLE